MSERSDGRAGATCWLVERRPDGSVAGGVAERADACVAACDGPLVQVEAAGFNYKDALACAGHPGVAKTLPLIPGIDAAGTLVEAAAGLPAGTAVVVTGNGLGETRHGAFSTLLRPPAEAIVARPPELSAHAAMALGTAGLTVLLTLDRLAEATPRGHRVAGDGEWLVTGASGGVGMLAVAALAAAGRKVVACSRKPTAEPVLRALGAASLVHPDALRGDPGRPLVRGRWSGVIDTVGGPLLADVLRAVLPGGVVAAIGMAGGVDLATTVYPFILRGVTLCGIDAATLPTQAERAALWPRIAALWPTVRDTLPVTTLALEEVGDWADALRRGEAVGRAVVQPATRIERHTINLAGAWERSGDVWRRSFGRPGGVEAGDTIRLVIHAPGEATVTLNGTPLPDLRSGAPRWSHDVTALLRDRNELVLADGTARGADTLASRRITLPEQLGHPTLEIVSRAIHP
ncbi:MAG: zinc-binding dehydrogenase [Planctomycetia bacterium]